MNVSTFTKGEKFKIIAVLVAVTILLIYSRKLNLILVSFVPAAAAALLIMRTRILRRFAHMPIRQVAYAALMEPIQEYRYYNAGRDEDGRLIEEKRLETVGYRKRDIPLVRHIDHCYVDLDEEISRKGNRSVMVCGRSGMGKSELMKVLLLSSKEPKIVFSFKPNDAYPHLPYRVIDVSRHIPDPFQDADSFSIAYSLAFPANLKGIMLSQVRAIVKSVARESKNWIEFKEKLKQVERKATDIQQEALSLIEQQIESLAVGEGSFSIDLTQDTVLDFSYLDESAKTFYAEIALRQIWGSVTSRLGIQEKGRKKIAIVIDEVHRLTQAYEMEAKTIVDTLMRQIRQFGTLYTATQNYSDMPDALRNQFATQLTFNTTSEKDLEAIRKIDSAYVWIVKELRRYEFVDLTFRVGNTGVVPIFRADQVEMPEREVEYNNPAGITRLQPRTEATATSCEEVTRAALAGEDAVWSPTGLAAEFAKRNGTDENTAKLRVSKVLQGMLNNDELQRVKFEMPQDGRVMVLYFRKSVNENESPFHRWMVGKIVEGRKDVIRVAASGEALPDVETGSRYVEAETGLKRRADDLEERIARFGRIKPFVIVVPNSDVAETYRKLASDRVMVKTLREFLHDKP
jgi:hypothetical protein